MNIHIYDKHVLTLFISKIKSNKIVIFEKLRLNFLMILHINDLNYTRKVYHMIFLVMFAYFFSLFFITFRGSFFLSETYLMIYLSDWQNVLSQFEMEKSCEVDKYFPLEET